MNDLSFKLLLLEDNPTDILLLREAMREASQVTFEIVTAERLAEAIRLIQTQQFDLVLADLNLPDSAGIGTINQIRHASRALPVVVLTGTADEQMALAALHEGAQDYLIKGMTGSDALVRAIRYAIERKRSEELELAKEAAERANAAKDLFLAALSHELRTPLSPVMAAVQLLSMNPGLPPEAKQIVEVAKRNVLQEIRLIDDLLDTTRIARGKLVIERRLIDIPNVINRALEAVQEDIKAKGIELKFEQCLGGLVDADSTRLQQVIWNLLNNAIKFTPSGGAITVACRMLDKTIQIEVRDTGIGIEPEALERIFNTFEQQGKTVTRQYGGLGLGLAISKSIVQLHGGSIRAESPGPGKGAIFIVALPLAPETAPLRKTDGASGPRPKPKLGAKVLLIEDHSDTVTVMNTVLSNAGFQVTNAYNLQEGRAVLQGDEIDLLICDLALPDGSGLDFMAEVSKAHPSLKGIAVSGCGRDEDVEQSMRAGFSEHLVKPVNIDRLLGALHRSVPKQERFSPLT